MIHSSIIKALYVVLIINIVFFFFLALIHYPGEWYIYSFFSLAFNSLLYTGFRKNKIFFDTFIGLFFWLGYWLKFSFRIIFMEGKFNEPIGTHFNYSGYAYDHALLVATCGACALLFASFIRRKYLFDYKKGKIVDGLQGIYSFYVQNRKRLWIAFGLIILTVSTSNAYFGFYQRGSVPRTTLPFGLSGVYTWLLLFGMASISALIIDFELRRNKKTTYSSILLALFETLLSSVSMLSRGMILNVSGLALGTIEKIKLHNIHIRIRYCITISSIFFILFGISLIAVTQVRDFGYKQTLNDALSKEGSIAETLSHSRRAIWLIIIDRWVGIEGVMAVSSYPYLGWELWQKAWDETYSNQGTSFYDLEIASSVYTRMDFNKHHHISLPGVIGFFYYPGSYMFLFTGIFLVGIFSAVLELFIFKLCDSSFIVASLLAQVIASRYTHFGYVPSQSYLLFGTIVGNVLIIYMMNKGLSYYYWAEQPFGLSIWQKKFQDSRFVKLFHK